MKTVIIILILFISGSTYSQSNNNDIRKLNLLKEEITDKIDLLKDSLVNIEIQISVIKSAKILNSSPNSNLFAEAFKGAKIYDVPKNYGRKLIMRFKERAEVKILNYVDGYYQVCFNAICGYMASGFIRETDEIKEFRFLKEEQHKNEKIVEQRNQELEEEQKRNESEIAYQNQKLKNAQDYALKLENIKVQYGNEVYVKVKAHKYWIGMTHELARVSLGRPNDINRTVGSWGVHEQWVYSRFNLYFEDGILTSYQN